MKQRTQGQIDADILRMPLRPRMAAQNWVYTVTLKIHRLERRLRAAEHKLRAATPKPRTRHRATAEPQFELIFDATPKLDQPHAVARVDVSEPTQRHG